MIRSLPYDDLVRRVVAHHRRMGEDVDFWLMPHVGVVGMYRVRKTGEDDWNDLLPTGLSTEGYQKTIQRLAPILFPDDQIHIKSIRRETDQVHVDVGEREGR